MSGPSNFDLAPPQWALLRQLLRDALDLPPAQRQAWIDRLDGEFAALKPRLQALLAHADEDGAESMLATLPKVETSAFAAAVPAAGEVNAEGQRIGPYRLLRVLGEGGMGSVWLAERTDMLQGRPVALKLPRRTGNVRNLTERMAREREILATLDHPNIARLYDAGVTGDGQPFLALEVVEGEALDAYAAKLELNVEARLRLFLQVLRAVAHAHARLAVHRDLKPSNILVDASGQAKLLDFGIAKLLSDGVAAETALTQEHGRALTLLYASPEQIAGRALDTRSDIYSLGVVLYELLTGQRPYRLERDSRAAVEEAVLNVDPARPSTTVTSGPLRRALRGDLDTIVLRALKKLPVERYGTAEAFAQDIERHLANEPVLAQPDSRAYRLRKFVARNTLVVGATTAVAMALLVGAGVATWQARVAIAERNRAQEVRSFIESIFRDADPVSGAGKGPMTVAALLRLAQQRVDRDLAERPAMRVEMLGLIGRSQTNLQETQAALATLDDAVAAANRSLGPEHPLALRTRVARLNAYRYAGKTADIRAELDRLLPLLRAQGQDHESVVDALQVQASVAVDEARYADAIRIADEALALSMKFLDGDPDRAAKAAIVLSIGHVSAGQSAQGKAVALQAQALALRAHDGETRHPLVIDARIALGRALCGLGEMRECIDMLTQVLRDTAAHFGPDAIEVAFRNENLASYLIFAGDVRRAVEAAAAATEGFKRHNQSGALFYPSARSTYAMALLSARRLDAAIREFEAVIPELESRLTPMHAIIQAGRAGLSVALAYAGRSSPPNPLQAEIDAGTARGRPHRFALRAQSISERMRGHPDNAVRLARAAVDASAGLPPMGRMLPLSELGQALMEQGRYAEAEPVLVEAIELLTRIQIVASPDRADADLALGRTLLALGRGGEALPLLAQADDFWHSFDPGSRWAGEAAYWRAHALESAGQTEEARATYTRAARSLAHSPIAADAALAREARRAAEVRTGVR